METSRGPTSESFQILTSYSLNSIRASEFPGSHAADHDQIVQSFVSFILGARIPSGSFSANLERKIFRALARQDELGIKYSPGERITCRREHLSESDLAQLEEPFLDREVLNLRGKLGLPEPQRPWPNGKQLAVCITHDMDHVSSFNVAERWRGLFREIIYQPRGLQSAKRFLKTVRTTAAAVCREYLLKRRDPLSQVREWMQIEADCGFKSTLYYLPSTVSPWHPYDGNYAFRDSVRYRGTRMSLAAMMREIADAGWEIGLHGTYYSATQPGVLKSQKEELEQTLGRPVVTTRQHYLQYDPAKTPAIQAAAGFHADSTQGFNDLLGFRAGTSFPYLCWDWNAQQLLPILEVPLHIQDVALLGLAKLSREAAIEKALQIMDSVEQVGGCLVILWHPHWLATEIGLSVFRAVLVAAKSRDAWGCTTRELADWWRLRTEQCVSTPAPPSVSA